MSSARYITYDTREVLQLVRKLGKVQAELRKEENGKLRDAAGEVADDLVSVLRGSAGGTPQAAIVAASVDVKRDRVPAVKIGGAKRVGHRGTPAGEILWGSEYGGRNFAAPQNGAGYWITPAVNRFRESGAVDAYTKAVVDILQANGVL